MKTLNRWITYLLVFAMLLSMTACGKKAPQAATTDAQQLPAQQTEQSAAQIPTEATTATEPAATEPPVSGETGDSFVVFAAIAVVAVIGVAVVAKRREN